MPGGVGGFTWGNNIYFASGQGRPDTNSGLAAIAHELVHVRQFNALGTSGFARRYIEEYLGNIRKQLPSGAAFTPPPMPTQFDIFGYEAIKYFDDLNNWINGLSGSFPNLDLGKAYQEISLETEAARYEEQLLNWLDAKPGRNPCD